MEKRKRGVCVGTGGGPRSADRGRNGGGGEAFCPPRAGTFVPTSPGEGAGFDMLPCLGVHPPNNRRA